MLEHVIDDDCLSVRTVRFGVQQCSVECGGIMTLHIGVPVSDVSILNSVGLVEAVPGECLDFVGGTFNDLSLPLLVHLLAGELMVHSLLHEPVSLLFHQHGVLLAHCLAHDICTTKATASHLADSCHDLLLIDQNAVCLFKVILLFREEVDSWLCSILAVN